MEMHWENEVCAHQLVLFSGLFPLERKPVVATEQDHRKRVCLLNSVPPQLLQARGFIWKSKNPYRQLPFAAKLFSKH